MSANTSEFLQVILARYFSDFPASIILATLHNQMDANTEYTLIPCMVRLQKFAAQQFNAYSTDGEYCENLSGLIAVLDTFLARMPHEAVLREYAPAPKPYTGVCPYIPTIVLGCTGFSSRPRVEKRTRVRSCDSDVDADTTPTISMAPGMNTGMHTNMGNDADTEFPAAKRRRF